MKQIARENLTIADKLEIIKRGRFEIKSIKHGHSYTVKTIFKDKKGQEVFISIQLQKKYFMIALPLIEERTFIPEKVFPNILIIEGFLSKDFFYYPKGERPYFKNVYNLSQYRQEVLKMETTFNIWAYNLLKTLKQFIEKEKPLD